MTDQCPMCGVALAEQDNPLARLAAWPPMFDPGEFTLAHGWSKPLPTKEDMCRQCQKLLAAPLAVSPNTFGG